MYNKKFKARPEIMNINRNKSSFYSYNVKISNCMIVLMTSMINVEKGQLIN